MPPTNRATRATQVGAVPAAKLAKLSDVAQARIKQAEADAEEVLTTELRQILAGSNIAKIKGTVTSLVVLPPFEKYAVRVFDAEAQERVSSIQISGSQPAKIDRAVLRAVVGAVVGRIAKAPRGVWPRVVKSACRYTGLFGKHTSARWFVTELESRTEHQSFTVGELMTPREDRLRSRLRFRMKHWESVAWQSIADSARTNPGEPSPGDGIRLGLGLPMTVTDESVGQCPGTSEPTSQAGSPAPLISKRRKRDPHPDPESVLQKNPSGLRFDKAGELLGVGKRQIQQLVKEDKLVAQGVGNARRITVASLRKRLQALPTQKITQSRAQ